MNYRVYVFMKRDELGDSYRAYGNDFLEGEYKFPDYTDNEAMWEAYLAWEANMVERANKEWQEMYGSESYIYLEETYKSQYSHNHYFYGL